MTQRKGNQSKSRKWIIRIAIGAVVLGGVLFLIHTIVQAHQ